MNSPEMKLRKTISGTSLVAQWLRVCLPIAGDTGSSPGPGGSHMLQSNQAHVPQLLKPTCSRAREPQLLSPRATTTEARMPRAHALQQEKPPQGEAHALQRTVAPARRN